MDAFAHHAVPRQPAAPRRCPEALPTPGAAEVIHRWISSVFHDVMVVVARIAGGLLVLAAGALHLWLYFDYFHRVHVIGVLFLLNAAAAAVIGIALLRSSHPLAAAAGVAYAAATLTGFFLSVYVGLFGFYPRSRHLNRGRASPAVYVSLCARPGSEKSASRSCARVMTCRCL